MLYKTLNQTHPTYDAKHWAKNQALYNAGKDFAAHVSGFMPQSMAEPDARYRERLAMAPRAYEPHVSNIIDQAGNQLFAFPMAIRLQGDKSESRLPEYYASFKEACTRSGLDLQDFARERFASALVKGASYWLVELPTPDNAPASLAEYQEQGLGEGWLTPVDPENLLDWECDASGGLAWAVLHWKRCERATPEDSRSTVVETWKVYDRQTVRVFEARYPEGKPPRDKDAIPLVSTTEHGTGAVPLMGIVLPPALAMMDRAGPLQLQHFDLKMALYWATKATCYAMPVIKRENPSDAGKPIFGAGYYLELSAKDDLGWAQPDGSTFEAQANQLKSIKEEIYRVCNATQLGIDNSAASIGRSGDSKAVDVAISEVGLMRFGAMVREAIQRTLNLLSHMRGESLRFDVSGLDRFSIQMRGVSIEQVAEVLAMDVPSETFRKELLGFVSQLVLGGLPAGVSAQIRDEIQASEKPEKPEPQPISNQPEAPAEEPQSAAKPIKPTPTNAKKPGRKVNNL